MRDRSEQILRIACLTLAALVLLQLVYAGFQINPLAGVKIPAVPSLGTNENSTFSSASKLKPPTTGSAVETGGTNKIKTSLSTNLIAAQTSGGTNPVVTNVMAQAATSNSPAAGTNPVVTGTAKISGSNLPPAMAMAGGMGMAGGPMMPGMAGNAPKLPPEIQARVDQIVNSEIFAPVMHPMPMGLLGIAGETAFLRSTSGQTGLVKAGDSLGDLKLLKIGINRVLVEQDGKEQELTIFNGYGGDSLLSKPDGTSK